MSGSLYVQLLLFLSFEPLREGVARRGGKKSEVISVREVGLSGAPQRRVVAWLRTRHSLIEDYIQGTFDCQCRPVVIHYKGYTMPVWSRVPCQPNEAVKVLP